MRCSGGCARTTWSASARSVLVNSDPCTNDVHELRAYVPKYIAPDGPTPLWRGMEQAMSVIGKEQDDRRAILVLTDGKDTGAIGIGGFGRHVPSEGGVIDAARAADVMIYAVGMRSVSAPADGMACAR